MATNRSVTPTTEYIQSLYNEGNYAELQKLNETLAKRSNQRLATLEKQGFDNTQAYKRAEKFISDSEFAKNKRFSRSKKMDIDSLFDQVKQEANFLRWQTSTKAGELKRREKIFDSLTSQRINPETGDIEEPLIQIPSNMDYDEFKNTFLKFLEDDTWEELKKHIYHHDILNEAGEAISAGASVEELKEAFNRYRNGEVNPETGRTDDLLTIWDNWTKVT